MMLMTCMIAGLLTRGEAARPSKCATSTGSGDGFSESDGDENQNPNPDHDLDFCSDITRQILKLADDLQPLRNRFAHSEGYVKGKHLRRSIYGHIHYGRKKLGNGKFGDWVVLKISDVKRMNKAISLGIACENIRNEVRVQARLNSIDDERRQYVGLLLDYAEDPFGKQEIFQVLEYYNQGDLCKMIERRGQGPSRKRYKLQKGKARDSYDESSKDAGYFRNVVTGVSFLHANNIAHRDLSLENVVLHNDVPKIIDFGIAIDLMGKPDGYRLEDHVGKTLYMSPETAAGNYCPYKNDTWCLGVMLLLMLLSGDQPPMEPWKIVNKYGCTALQRYVKKWLGPEGKQAPTAAIDLVLKIFQPEASRISIGEILKHPYLA